MKKTLIILVFLLPFSNYIFAAPSFDSEKESFLYFCEDNQSRDISVDTKFVGEYRVDIYSPSRGSGVINCNDRKVIIKKMDTDEVVIYLEGLPIYFMDTFYGLEQKIDNEEYLWMKYCSGSSGCHPMGYYLGNKHPIKEISFVNINARNCKTFPELDESKMQCSILTTRKEFYGVDCALALWTYDIFLFEFNYDKYTKSLVEEGEIEPECRTK